MRLKHLIIYVFTLMGITSHYDSAAQDKTPPDPGGYWLSYTGDNKINHRTGLHSELQWRNVFLPHTMQTILARVGLNIYISPQAMATAGYGFIYNTPSSSEVAGAEVLEHRIWEQLILRQKTRNIFMEHRYRLEQRYLNNKGNNTQQVDHRMRYRFQTLFPMYSVSPHLRHYFIAFNNEIFINLRKDPSRIFDRNRLFAGVGYQVSPKMNFQLGYMNQFIHTPGRSLGQTDHIMVLGMAYNMDDIMSAFFRKKDNL